MTALVYSGIRRPERVEAAQWDGSSPEAANAICSLFKAPMYAGSNPPVGHPALDVDISWSIDGSDQLLVSLSVNGNPPAVTTIPKGSWYVTDGTVYSAEYAQVMFDLTPLRQYSNARTDQDVS